MDRFKALTRTDLCGRAAIELRQVLQRRVKLNLFVNTGEHHDVTQQRSSDWALYYSELADGHSCS